MIYKVDSLYTVKKNPNFQDITPNVEENEIQYEKFCFTSCFFRYILCYISENQLPQGQCRRYNIKCSGENVILGGLFHVVSCFTLNFILYRGNLVYFSDSVYRHKITGTIIISKEHEKHLRHRNNISGTGMEIKCEYYCK